MYDLIIVGGGPAGMTAALYALRAEKRVLLLEGEVCGGQITKSRGVENYPGITEINGMDLADAMLSQIRALGVELRSARATGLRVADGGYEVLIGDTSERARAVILATGLQHRSLGVVGEADLIGRGVSFCAVCDGAFFRRKEVAVVGGGNTAVQDALYLSEICSRVYLIHRRDGFRAEESLLARARETENIEFITNTVVREIRGEMRLQGLLLENVQTGKTRELEVSGLFEAVGQIPQNAAFSDVVSLDGDGYLSAGEDCKTALPGVFVAGDCRSKTVRQLTTAVSDGTVASLAALAYLDGTVS